MAQRFINFFFFSWQMKKLLFFIFHEIKEKNAINPEILMLQPVYNRPKLLFFFLNDNTNRQIKRLLDILIVTNS